MEIAFIIGYVAPHSSTIRRSLKRLQLVHQARLVERLQHIDSISLTCDFWSNRSSKSFFVLTGHFISTRFKLKRTVLDFSHFPEHHSADEIAHTLRSKLRKLNIVDRTVSMTCDGASNLKKALSNVGVNDRVWCLGHRLHLIIANGLGLWLTEKDRKKRSEKELGKDVTTTTVRTTQDTGDSSDEETVDEDKDDSDDYDGEEEACSIDAGDDIEINDDPKDQEVDDNTDDENDLVSRLRNTSVVFLLCGILSHQLTTVSLRASLRENVWIVSRSSCGRWSQTRNIALVTRTSLEDSSREAFYSNCSRGIEVIMHLIVISLTTLSTRDWRHCVYYDWHSENREAVPFLHLFCSNGHDCTSKLFKENVV